jgi:signal transduction protein with GAF and PtsI domain
MSVGSLLRAKKVIMSFSHTELVGLLQQALAMPDAFMIREMYATKLDERGLGGFLRAGK